MYRLASDLLLVFKPCGHREPTHAHPYCQRLRLLRGRLAVNLGARRVTLTPTSDRLTVRARLAHGTEALQDTWVLVESPLE